MVLNSAYRIAYPRLGSAGGDMPLGPALGLSGGRVACFPVLTALKEGEGAVLHQGLLWKGGNPTLDDNPSAPPPNPQHPQQPEKYFFGIGLTH